MEMALIENIQREDLNSLEIALAYQHLLEQYELTQERLSERVGKKRTTVANYLRLLKLPATIQMALKNKEIDMGHARALLALNDPKTQIRIFNEILEHDYSVRKVEDMVKALTVGESVESGGKNTPCCRITFATSSAVKCNCRARLKEKEKSAYLSAAKPTWNASWKY